MEDWAKDELANILYNYTPKRILEALQKLVQANADSAIAEGQSARYEWNCNVSASAINTAIGILNEAGAG